MVHVSPGVHDNNVNTAQLFLFSATCTCVFGILALFRLHVQLHVCRSLGLIHWRQWRHRTAFALVKLVREWSESRETEPREVEWPKVAMRVEYGKEGVRLTDVVVFLPVMKT